MKKIIGFVSLMFAANLCYAEDIQFATVLSSPIGTFTNLETADPTAQTYSGHVTFCNTRAPGGTITLAGPNTPNLGKIVLHAGAGLNADSVSELAVGHNDGVQLKKGGTLGAAAIYANGVNLPSANTYNHRLKAEDMYTNNLLAVRGLKTNKLYIGSACKDPDTRNTNACSRLENQPNTNQYTAGWTNEFQKDYAEGDDGEYVSLEPETGRDYNKEFLLKVGARRSIGHFDRYYLDKVAVGVEKYEATQAYNAANPDKEIRMEDPNLH